MSTSTFRLAGAIVTSLVFLISCQKDIQAPESITADPQSADSRLHNGKLRLIERTSDFGSDTYEYNKKGLVWKWYMTGYGLLVHEYDKWDRLKKSTRFADDGSIVLTVYFYYNRKGQRYREKWYLGDTKENIIEDITWEFDHKGRIKKAISPLENYVMTAKWTKDDNILEWNLYVNKTIAINSRYTYGKKIKNPYAATPGIGYAYPFFYGFIWQSPDLLTSETATFYDENGSVIDSYTQDPSKTLVEIGPKGYVTSVGYLDFASQEYLTYGFNYEKGKGGRRYGECKNKKLKAWSDFQRRDGKQSMKEKIKQFRNAIR